MKYLFFNDYKNYSVEEMMQMYWSGANGFCFDDTGKVAIVYENEKGYWTLPGGGRENGENPVQTFVREVREEAQAQVDMDTLKYFHCVSAKFFDDTGKIVMAEPGSREEKLQQNSFRFICKLKNINDFVPRKDNFEIDERKFVTLDELPDYITWLRDSENGAESFQKLKEIISHL